MATVTKIERVCDLTGVVESPDQPVHTVQIGPDREIDLVAPEAERYHAMVNDYVAKSRPIVRTKGTGKATSRQLPADRKQSAEIRAWVREHGYQIADRGRIPMGALAAWAAKDPSLLKTEVSA